MQNIKKDFPIFKRNINGKPLVYLDSASTSQKPKIVVDALQKFYTTNNANIHRGIHTLSEEATEQYEMVRKKIAQFIGAKSEENIIFTKNTTEAINCVRLAWAEQYISKGDEVIVSALEHHANLVPWQELCRSKEAILKVIPLAKDFTLDLAVYQKLLSSKTKLVCVTAQSNVTGTIVPIKKIANLAHTVGAKILVDGAQTIGHREFNVQKINCDWLAFSAHKMLGPTGVGVLYVKNNLIDQMTPYLYGGEMVEHVEQESASYRNGPGKFEAGTPNIADVIAFGAALDYLTMVGLKNIAEHDKTLMVYTKKMFAKYPQATVFSPQDSKISGNVLSFSINGIHPHDIATIFDQEGVAIRSGFHCAEPLIHRLEKNGTARLSFYLYNTTKDIDAAEKALKKVLKIFKITN